VITVVIAVVVAGLLLAVVVMAIVLVAQWRSEQRYSARHFPLITPSYSANTWQPEPFEAEVPVSRALLVADVAPSGTTQPRNGTTRSDGPRPRYDNTISSANGVHSDKEVHADHWATAESGVHADSGLHADSGQLHEPAPAETVRFNRPVEEVLQLLPGRLEVLAGETRHREIRFVRAPGQPPQLILGRDAAGSAQHVALQSSTVSRRHARLAYSNGTWAVANLSQTNPVIVNDEELSGLDRERPLVDGDRIELGEVVLRFHAH
jgi:hypothetical protein